MRPLRSLHPKKISSGFRFGAAYHLFFLCIYLIFATECEPLTICFLQDPTLQRSTTVDCKACGHNEAVFFQVTAHCAVLLSSVYRNHHSIRIGKSVKYDSTACQTLGLSTFASTAEFKDLYQTEHHQHIRCYYYWCLIIWKI